jgi:hypothetical protein
VGEGLGHLVHCPCRFCVRRVISMIN